MSFKNSWKTNFICFLISYGIMLFFRSSVLKIIVNVFFNNSVWKFTGTTVTDVLISLIILLLSIMVIHELIHAMMFTLFKGKIIFRLNVIFPYAQEVSEKTFDRTSFMIILLSPLIIISILSLSISSWFGTLIFLLNFFLSTADILKVLYLFKAKQDSKIIHRVYGYDIINKDSEIEANSNEA